jgi:ubiquinone/menaquinone biosynthesis C-methylase UbiE
MNLPKGIRYSYLVFSNLLTCPNSKFQRQLEPSSITDGQDFVDDYNRASDSIMMLPYVQALDTIHRIQGKKEMKQAIDLCSGPGHFSRLLAKQKEIKNVTCVDLSEPMLSYAERNAEREKLLAKMHFIKNDVTKLDSIQNESIDLTTFLNGAHHFNSIDEVKKVLIEAERITKADGLIYVMDPVRQKNKKISDMYFNISGEDYVRKGMNFFNKDFYNSLLASFRPQEFIHAIPENSKRQWVLIVPFGVPSFQILIGLSKDQKKLFQHSGSSISYIKTLIPEESLADWKMFNFSFRFGRVRWIKAS